MQKISPILALFLISLTGCAGTPDTPTLSYPATDKCTYTFVSQDIPRKCKVFSQVIVASPAKSTGASIKQAIEIEARKKGADLLFIGFAREVESAESEFDFTYYGPESAYIFRKGWQGWKFGFEQWDKSGQFADLGYNSYGNAAILYDNGLNIQAVFLKCQ